ncbi:MAG: PAS domain S-box protein [Acidobacteria bacterium]|nr:PAS domain S-box protein [Acidobacteriota bacterium]
MMSSLSGGSAPAAIPSLSGETLLSLFPFYLYFDRDCRIVNCGPSLSKACPDVKPGQFVTHLFTLERPRIPFTIDSISASADSLFLLKHIESGLQLRGQLVLAEKDSFLILGSPWVLEFASLSDHRLSISDFAIHDVTPQVIQSSVSQKLAIGDLRRAASKLESQREELQQALNTIREGEAQRRLLSLIVSNSRDAVAVTDSSKRIEWINESFTSLTGYSLEEVRGLSLGTLLRGERTDAPTAEALITALDANQAFRCVLASHRKDGQHFWGEMAVQPVSAGTGGISNFVGVIRDVTVEHEEALRNALLLSVTRALTEADDAQQAAYEAIKVIAEAMGACYGGLWWIAEETGSLLLERFWANEQVADSPFLKTSQSISYKAGEGIPGQVWLDGSPILLPRVEDLSANPLKELAVSAGIRSGMAFPVRAGTVTSGVIELFSSRDDTPSTFLLPVIEYLSLQIGQLVERRKAEIERDRSLSLLRSALDSAPYGVVITDLRGSAIRFNDRWAAILRIDESIDRNRWWEPFIRQFRHTEEQLAEWVRLKSQYDKSLIAHFPLLDGRTIEAVTNARRQDGQLVGQVWQFRDVTAFLAEQRERESLVSTLNSTLEATNDGILVTGLANERLAFNQRFLDMWRIPRPMAEANREKSLVPLQFDQLVDPAAFANRLSALEAAPSESANDLFELSGDRAYELYSQPQRIGDRVIGRVWCYRDVSASRRAIGQLQKSEERYRLVTEAAPASIVTFGSDGVIQFANQKATSQFCGPKGSLIGASVKSFFPDTMAKVYSRLLQGLFAGTISSETPTIGIWLVDASGQLFPAEVHIGRPLQANTTEVTAIIRDVSSRHALERKLLEEAASAAKANRAKSDFLANISHEIRTPLNAIVGLAEILRGSNLSEDLRESIDSIWFSAESLLELINDLLDISKIEAGQVDLDRQDIDLAEVAERAVDIVRIRATAKNLEVYLIVEPSMPPVVREDPNRIRQVLVNLLSNAVKFTQAGSVTLRLQWQQAAAGVDIQFYVTDTGTGIAPSEQDRIFESFYRSEFLSPAQSGGAGLGLGISRAIATRLGGSISVTSAVGEGSSFLFSLPGTKWSGDAPVSRVPNAPVLVASFPARLELQVGVLRSAGLAAVPCTDRESWPKDISRFSFILVDEEWADFHDWEPSPSTSLLWLRMKGRAARPDRHPVLLSPLTPARVLRAIHAMGRPTAVSENPIPSQRDDVAWRILLVEDHPAGQLYVRKLLTGHGYKVIIAARADEARAMLQDLKFDLVLMDAQLPDGFGPDLIAELRSLEVATSRPRTPVIVLSAQSLQRFSSAAHAAGADDYIAKPVRPGTLVQRVRNWLRKDIRVLILAQTPEMESALSALIPSAAITSMGQPSPVEISKEGVLFDLVIVAGQCPSRGFVAWALSTVAPFPSASRVLLGEGWTDELTGLVGGGGVFGIPASVVEMDRLVRQNVGKAAGPADRAKEQEFALQIAALAPNYLKGLANSLNAVRESCNERAFADIATFAHRMKGTGAAYGFPDLTKLAVILEDAAHAEDPVVVSGLVDALERDILMLEVRINSTQ